MAEFIWYSRKIDFLHFYIIVLLAINVSLDKNNIIALGYLHLRSYSPGRRQVPYLCLLLSLYQPARQVANSVVERFGFLIDPSSVWPFALSFQLLCAYHKLDNTRPTEHCSPAEVHY